MIDLYIAGQCIAKEEPKLPLTALPGFGALSMTSVMLILLLVCLPPLHGVSRGIFKPWVLFHVERGLTWVTLAQRHQRQLLTTLSSMSCITVSITFYITFLPLLMWVRPIPHASNLAMKRQVTGQGFLCAKPRSHFPRRTLRTSILALPDLDLMGNHGLHSSPFQILPDS